jgi:hypothetical protein
MSACPLELALGPEPPVFELLVIVLPFVEPPLAEPFELRPKVVPLTVALLLGLLLALPLIAAVALPVLLDELLFPLDLLKETSRL